MQVSGPERPAYRKGPIMQIVFRVAYSLAVAILFILFVIFGTRTFYSEPDYPTYPPMSAPFPSTKNIYCDSSECYIDGLLITSEVEGTLSESEKTFLRQQREFQQRQRDFEDEQRDYYRNVFIIAAALGIAAIAAGLYLFRRVEAMPLGLLLGGLGAVIYGWVESAQGPDDASNATLFAVATAGLVVVLAGGYWFLNSREPDVPPG